MCEFIVGQKVVCVVGVPKLDPLAGYRLPAVGEQYTIRNIGLCGNSGVVVVSLLEIADQEVGINHAFSPLKHHLSARSLRARPISQSSPPC
jgi:hypothetical protein